MSSDFVNTTSSTGLIKMTKPIKLLEYPRGRSGNICKQVACIRYEAYQKWNCGDSALKFCMNCKYSHVSQYERNPTIVKI